MKKTATLLVALLCAVTVTFAQTRFEVNGINCEIITGTKTTKVIAKTPAYSGAVTIPNSVTAIDGNAFNGCLDLTAVTIPNTVTTIGADAFLNCTKLTSVTSLNTVPPTLGANAFLNMPTSKATLYVPEGSIKAYKDAEQWKEFETIRTTITVGATFEEDGISYKVTDIYGSVEVIAKTPLYEGEVTIPPSVTHDSKTYSVTAIGRRAFEKCSGLTSITIPNSVKAIKFFAFDACSQLASVAIPNGVVTIEDAAFGYCSNLSSITFGDSVETIGGGAFTNCRSLLSITIPNSVTNISQGLFTNCDKLTSVTIGNNVKIIDKQAFSDCKSLTSITIPSSVTNINERAFEDCSSLTVVTCLSPTPPTLGANVFSGVSTTTATLYVPEEKIAEYGNAEHWKAFKNIKTAVPTSVTTASTSAAKVYALAGTLYVEGAAQPYTVHSLTGAQVYVGTAPSLTLPSGMYVVSIGKERHKVVVR